MNKDIKAGLAWAAAILAVAFAAILARQAGYIDADAARRSATVMIGLMVAWMGNRMPKAFVPSACARQFRLVGGWSMLLSGLVYAGLWAFAPTQVAFTWGCAAIIAGVAVTIGYGLSLRARVRAA